MALIKCPECGKEISDRSKMCIGCGFPLDEYMVDDKKDDVVMESKKEGEGSKHTSSSPYSCICLKCRKENLITKDYCAYCGNKLLNQKIERDPLYPYPTKKELIERDHLHPTKKEFHGIYKYNFRGQKSEVYCPRCGSENCQYFTTEKFIPGKTKTTYKANINPLKPFTLVNKKEKVISQDRTITEQQIICNDCGKIFS